MLGQDRRFTAEGERAQSDESSESADRLGGGELVPDSEVNVERPKPLNQFLRMAVMAGVESAVQLHIERGDDLNARDASGMTSLMLSAARNKPGICKLLLGAGADPSLLAPSGKTALQIAIAAGSDDAAAVLQAASDLDVPAQLAESDFGPVSESAVNEAPAFAPIPPETAADESEESRQQDRQDLIELSVLDVRSSPAAAVEEVDDDGFDLSGWEAEEESARPVADLAIQVSASAIQMSITAHEPIDSSTGWDDIEAYLPDVAMPLANADDAEGRAQLRRLLLRALREGSVPYLDVQALSANEDRTANADAEAYLSMVINDLGAEVDERFEYATAYESFEVFVWPDETFEEEAALDEALVAIDRATTPRHEPLRLYQREFQRLRLLTAEEEIQLARDMEAALDCALDALAAWPEGIERTLAAGAQAIAGSRPLSSIWVGGSEPDAGAASAESLEANESADDLLGGSTEEAAALAEATTADADEACFRDALRRLADLVGGEGGANTPLHEVRHALSALCLNRRFLLELIDVANGLAPCPGFVRSMTDFRKARDCMTAANLKLAFFHAKKFLHSGEPLDDLAQEGNIGLLKAIDRYDWRRGFRFSTYATWWIRQQISRYVADKARTIRIPVHIHEKIQRAERLARAFEETVGREPTLDELAERLELPNHKLTSLLSVAPEPSRIDELSIDCMIAAEARDDYVSPDPADRVEEMQLNQAVDRYISSLSTRDRKEERILRLRFGIGVDAPLTLDEVGTIFDVTRERIRQIEAKAIRKLQHPVRSKSFARSVLGMDFSPPKEADEANGSAVAQAAARTSAVNRSVSLSSSRESIQPTGSSKRSELNQVLALATDLGIHVEDDRLGSGRIWVEIVDARDANHRKLARRLHELGFEFWPGKGYWQ